MELFVCLLRPPRSFARSAARGRCRSAFRHEYVRPKTACHSLCLSAQLPSEDVQRTSVEIGNHRNALLRHKGRVNQVEVAMSLVQEGASLRTGACNRAEHQRQRWHDPLRLSFPFPQPTHRELLKELPTAWGAGDCDQQRVPERGSALGRAGAAALRSCTIWVLDTFFYHVDNRGEWVVKKWRSGVTNRWGTCAVSLAFILHKQIVASCSTRFPVMPRVRPIRSRAALSSVRRPLFRDDSNTPCLSRAERCGKF